MSPEQMARAEFVRALSTLEQVQLRTFAFGEIPPRANFIAQLDALEIADLDERCRAMREILADVSSRYNDSFCTYLTPAAYKRYTDRRRGGLMGIGIKFRAREDDWPVLIGVLQGGPLDEAGLLPGDLIEAVDGESVRGYDAAELARLFKGPEGSPVRVRFRRGEQILEPEIARQDVELHYVRGEWVGEKVAHLRISRFGGNTHERFASILQAFMQEGARAVIIDLRGNPGGSTRAARHIYSLFADGETVYCEQYRSGAVKRLPRAGEVRCTLPLAVLQNSRSMSSSEILAGALRESGRARLLGSPSYGKGLIQKVFALKSPLGGAIRATIAAYATPSGQLIHGVGLLPDIHVADVPHGVHDESGSLNISSAARAYRRQLLGESLAAELGQAEALRLMAMPDAPLERALELFG